MKCLTIFVHTAVADTFADTLLADPEISGFTLTPCQGHSPHTAEEAMVSMQDRVQGYVPRVRIDVVMEDSLVDPLLERLKEVSKAEHSWGTWIVTEVHSMGRF